MNNPLKYTDPSGYIHSHYWQKGGGDEDGIPGGGGSFGGNGGIGRNGGSNPGSYSYDYSTGKYIDYWGNEVTYSEVYNNYIYPNSSPDHLYTHVSNYGFNTDKMMDGFKLNGRMYEFSNPVPYNKYLSAQSQGYSGDYIFAKTWSEYMKGRTEPLIINTSALNLSHVSQSDLRADGSVNLANPKQFKLRAFNGTALALGNITLTPLGDNMYTIQRDLYDFDIKWEQGWSFRNIATAIAGFMHGGVFDNTLRSMPYTGMPSGTPYSAPINVSGYPIIFNGSVYIKPH